LICPKKASQDQPDSRQAANRQSPANLVPRLATQRDYQDIALQVAAPVRRSNGGWQIPRSGLPTTLNDEPSTPLVDGARRPPTDPLGGGGWGGPTNLLLLQHHFDSHSSSRCSPAAQWRRSTTRSAPQINHPQSKAPQAGSRRVGKRWTPHLYLATNSFLSDGRGQYDRSCFFHRVRFPLPSRPSLSPAPPISPNQSRIITGQRELSGRPPAIAQAIGFWFNGVARVRHKYNRVFSVWAGRPPPAQPAAPPRPPFIKTAFVGAPSKLNWAPKREHLLSLGSISGDSSYLSPKRPTWETSDSN